jgi:hypothetical protein
MVILEFVTPRHHNSRAINHDVIPQTTNQKKPAKAEVTNADFRRRLKNISDWRKKHLAELRALGSR